MLSIDEAIANAREVAAIQRNNDKLNKTLGVISPYYKADCIKCAEEHEQLAEWLEELKEYREIGTVQQCKNSVLDIERAYNKAIADFAERLCYKIKSEIDDCADELQWVDEIAEQLKAGESCENN